MSFLRKTAKKEDTLLIVCNFTPAAYDKYKVGVPYAGSYKEIFCSDNENFGGDGSKNHAVRTSRRSACDGRSNSITIGLAPLSMSIFKLVKDGADTANKKKATGKKQAAVTKPVRKNTTKKTR